MRTQQETNAINRVLKAWKMGSLDAPGAVPAMARCVQDHQHFSELLKACEPMLRRQMYEAMAPNLRFPAKPLEDYIIMAKQHAETMQLPTLDELGNLHGYMEPRIGAEARAEVKLEVEVPRFELIAQCSKCKAEAIFYGERKADAITDMRHFGWAFDEFLTSHLCPACLEGISALDKAPS